VVPVEQVRTAGDGDVDRLVELAAAFQDATSGRRGGARAHPADGGGQPPEASRDAVAAYVTEPGHTALVGLLDDWAAGAALCRVDDAAGGRRGVLDVCFVEPGAREVGLGRLLLERSLEWFRTEGCTGVDGTAFPGDRNAKQFFESAGFKARLLVMHLPLD
jgi:GNAT superfamily N-acetyltransferase